MPAIFLKRWLLRLCYTCTALLAACLLAGLLYALMAGRHVTGAERFVPTAPRSLAEAAEQAGTVLVSCVWPCLIRSGWSLVGTVFLLVASVWLLDASVRGWRHCASE